ncbi:splicing factor 3a, subunit 2 [Pseudoloma neurophilia]|uniref:Splicing factor 3a, subunit 2 n=1 Tax=Pseudoloma neurophilia TaxID=146866 RepID=A0A0R0LYU1_9MICR|nr:splicing factor 3a, subunit 2 [Pseudoloma neurophilia]
MKFLNKEEKRKNLTALINEIFTLSSDKNIIITSFGQIKCKLCKTIHNNESSYIVHRNSKKHQKLVNKNEKVQLLKYLPFYKIYNVKIINKENLNKFKIGYLIKIKTENEIYYKILSVNDQLTVKTSDNCNFLVIKTEKFDNIGIKIPKTEYQILKWFDGKIYKLQILWDVI